MFNIWLDDELVTLTWVISVSGLAAFLAKAMNTQKRFNYVSLFLSVNSHCHSLVFMMLQAIVIARCDRFYMRPLLLLCKNSP